MASRRCAVLVTTAALCVTTLRSSQRSTVLKTRPVGAPGSGGSSIQGSRKSTTPGLRAEDAMRRAMRWAVA
jgi:hypothetical protein